MEMIIIKKSKDENGIMYDFSNIPQEGKMGKFEKLILASDGQAYRMARKINNLYDYSIYNLDTKKYEQL
ncbi:MAG: hypothetical protein WC917_02600 [Bacilli bacterium]|jgi:hypothetical protein